MVFILLLSFLFFSLDGKGFLSVRKAQWSSKPERTLD
jgi:hypothetical protein